MHDEKELFRLIFWKFGLINEIFYLTSYNFFVYRRISINLSIKCSPDTIITVTNV